MVEEQADIGPEWMDLPSVRMHISFTFILARS